MLIRKDENRKPPGRHQLPGSIEIPTITGRIVAVSALVQRDEDYPISQYDKVLLIQNAIPVDFEGDNRLFVVPIRTSLRSSPRRLATAAALNCRLKSRQEHQRRPVWNAADMKRVVAMPHHEMTANSAHHRHATVVATWKF